MKNIDLKIDAITPGQFRTALCKQCDSDGGEWYRKQIQTSRMNLNGQSSTKVNSNLCKTMYPKSVYLRRCLRKSKNMRKCTVAIFTMVAAVFLTGVFLDIHFLQHLASVKNIDWTNTFNSINKTFLQTHSADGRQTGPNRDAKDHTMNLTDAKTRAISPTDTDNLAMRQTDTKNRAISQTDTDNRAISQADTKNRVISHTDTDNLAMRETDTKNRAISQTDTKNRAISQTNTKNRAISQTDPKNRAISQTDSKNRANSQTNSKNRAISLTDIRHHVTKPISLACPRNNSSPPLDDETRKRYEIHDLFRVKTPAFLLNYKNPCWKQDNPSKLVCLPYFYLIGFPKCGTTFTFNTIVGHPEAVMGKRKEPHWITKRRFAERSHIQSYLNYFSPAARVIESNASIDPATGQKFHPIITGDGSASTAFDNRNWRYLPGNYNCTEPRVLAPHYIYHLNPPTKVIILVKNPTDRVVSAYNYFTSGNITTESFHTKMVQDLRTFEDCCSKYSLRVCAYDVSIRVRGGLYHVFIRDWMKVFPADQILIARLEDIHDDPYRVFSRIFDFLGLSHVSRSELQEMFNKSSRNDRSRRFQAGNETRRLLDDFYRPHNIQLARLLQQHDPSSYSNIHDAMYSH